MSHQYLYDPNWEIGILEQASHIGVFPTCEHVFCWTEFQMGEGLRTNDDSESKIKKQFVKQNWGKDLKSRIFTVFKIFMYLIFQKLKDFVVRT